MPKYTVRLSGTHPVWADVEVEADSPEEALEKVNDGGVVEPLDLSIWEFCEGGDGVDDWTTTGDVYLDGEEVMVDGEVVE